VGTREALSGRPWPAAIGTHARYGRYLVRHKWFVTGAGLRLGVPLWRLVVHDWSKFLPDEWAPYAGFFYGDGRDRARKRRAFDRAWLLHQHRQPHHWQFWVLQEDSGAVRALEMPAVFVREMVADWTGAGRAIPGGADVRTWYRREREHIVLHPRSRALVERLLGCAPDDNSDAVAAMAAARVADQEREGR
jgi:hypothetical protein